MREWWELVTAIWRDGLIPVWFACQGFFMFFCGGFVFGLLFAALSR